MGEPGSRIGRYEIVREIGGAHRNVCVVGDDDQSIYGWRGAEVDNILRYEHDFPGARVIRLERNYRSTGHILAAASHLIAHNEGRLGKTLRTEDVLGEKVQVTGAWDSEEEARAIGEEIEQLQREARERGEDHPLDEIALLVRASFQMREFEDRFIQLGLPYRVIGGPRFYERAEIRDAMAYLRVVAQGDDDLAFERIVNVPKRGLGDATVQMLHDHARKKRMPLTEAARAVIETDELKPGEEKCTEHAHVGSDAVFTYTVTYADGTVKKEDIYSHYKPWQEVCLVGKDPNAPPAPTDGTALPSQDASGVTGN